MATPDSTMESKLQHFLFKQLFGTWYPDIRSVMAQRPLGDYTWLPRMPELQTPPLISALVSLADVPVEINEPEARKILPCGHFIHLRSILICSNIFGDLGWREGPNSLECPQPDCEMRYALPRIPDPWVIDGLEARLNLLQWIWVHSKGAPLNVDVNIGKMLRYILDQVRRGPRDLEPTSSWNGPSEGRQRNLLDLLEKEAVVLAEEKHHDGPRCMGIRNTSDREFGKYWKVQKTEKSEISGSSDHGGPLLRALVV